MATLATLQTALKLLSDPTRLRLVALLSREELAVHELVAVTGLGQSRVSNHLSLLKRSGLVHDRREGTWSFHRLAEPSLAGPLTPELFEAAVRPYLDSEAGAADAQALEGVREKRRERSRRAHDALAERWVEVGQEFATGSMRAEALSALAPRDIVVADLGCGAGFLTSFLADRGTRVIAVDHSARMLEAAQRRVADESIEWRQGELDRLPIATGEVDAAFANLVWHHLADFEQTATEIARIVRPGGRAVVTDLNPHDEEWMREAMGDHRLGVRPDAVVAALARAGFDQLRAESIRDRYVVERPNGARIELPLFLVTGVRDGDHGNGRLSSETSLVNEETKNDD